jgi:hypothetical protein
MRHDLVVSFPKKFLLDSLSLIRRAQDGGLSRLSKLLSLTHKSFFHSSSAILHEVATPISIKPEQS